MKPSRLRKISFCRRPHEIKNAALMRGGDEVLVGDVDPSVLLDYVLGEEDESALIDYLTAFLGESAAGFGVELAERRRQLRSYK